MKLFLDTAITDEVRKHFKTGLIDGLTTNPSLIRKSGRNHEEVYQEIKEIGLTDISMEVIGSKENMVSEGKRLAKKFPKCATIKVPCTPDGLMACKELSENNIRVNVTLIFSPSQAILAAKAGASYISPFIGRVADQYWDGLDLIKQIRNIYDRNEVETKILAASIRNPIDVPNAFGVGADVCTLPYDIFNKLFEHCLTTAGLEAFNKDWASLQEMLYDDE